MMKDYANYENFVEELKQISYNNTEEISELTDQAALVIETLIEQIKILEKQIDKEENDLK